MKLVSPNPTASQHPDHPGVQCFIKTGNTLDTQYVSVAAILFHYEVIPGLLFEEQDLCDGQIDNFVEIEVVKIGHRYGIVSIVAPKPIPPRPIYIVVTGRCVFIQKDTLGADRIMLHDFSNSAIDINKYVFDLQQAMCAGGEVNVVIFNNDIVFVD